MKMPSLDSAPPSLPPTGPLAACRRIQRGLIDGSLSVSDGEAAEHLLSCSECRFLQDLSRNLAGPSAGPPLEGPLSAFLDVCDRTMAEGKPVLGRYHLLRRLGFGGQGVVYQASDVGAQGELVALKLVRIAEAEGESSAREVALAHRVRHPGICRIYHTEAHGQIRFITMEYVAGGSLDTVAPGLSSRQRLAVFRRIAEAVHAAHQAGVLHLDLKPRNVLLRGPEEPIVTDFGLAVAVEDPRTAHGTGGTPRFMAPEQARRERVDRRTDLYALGILLGDLFPEATGRLRRVVRRCTEHDPAARFPDVGALLRALSGPSWRRAVPLRIAPPALLVVGFLLVPAPRGPRGQWYRELGRPDLIPAEAWNLALNTTGDGLPSVAASHEPRGCARSTRDLNDGAAHYAQWERGFAFAGPKRICVNLENVGHCGALKDDAPLCLMTPGAARDMQMKVKDRARAVVPPEGQLGQGEPGDPECTTEYAVTITLDRPRPVFAVRGWYVGMPPSRFGIQADDGSGQWRLVFATTENKEAVESPFGRPAAETMAVSVPITTQFPPVPAKRLRLTLRCDVTNPAKPSEAGNPVWLYEVEVFGRLSRLEAWWRRLFGAS